MVLFTLHILHKNFVLHLFCFGFWLSVLEVQSDTSLSLGFNFWQHNCPCSSRLLDSNSAEGADSIFIRLLVAQIPHLKILFQSFNLLIYQLEGGLGQLPKRYKHKLLADLGLKSRRGRGSNLREQFENFPADNYAVIEIQQKQKYGCFKLVHFSKKLGRLSAAGCEILAFGSYSSAKLKTDRVNNVVFHLHQIKHINSFGTPGTIQLYFCSYSTDTCGIPKGKLLDVWNGDGHALIGISNLGQVRLFGVWKFEVPNAFIWGVKFSIGEIVLGLIFFLCPKTYLIWWPKLVCWLFGVFEKVSLIIWRSKKIAWYEHPFPKTKELPPWAVFLIILLKRIQLGWKV